MDNIPTDDGIPVCSSISYGNVPADDSAMPPANLDDSQPEQGSTVQLDSDEGDLDFDLEGNAARLRLDNQKLRDENVKLRSQLTTTIIAPQLFENNENILQSYTGLPN